MVSSRPALVLVHGWGMSPAVWDDLRSRLDDRFELYTPNLEALVDTDWVSEDPLVDMDRLLDRLAEQVPERAIWLGWSLGGQIALGVARRWPERVSALISWASNPCFVATVSTPGMEEATFVQFAQGLAAFPSKTLQRFLALQVKGAKQTRATLKWLQQHSDPQVDEARGQRLSWLLSLLRADLYPVIGGLNCPQQYLFGSADQLVPLAAVEAVRRESSGADIHVVEGAAHLPFVTATDECLQALERVMEKLEAP